MPEILVHPLTTAYGELLLGSFEDRLCLCDWRYRRMRSAVDMRIQRGLSTSYVQGMSPVIEATMDQLNAYFGRQRPTFDVPLRFVGTDFQQRVWEALLTIPFGATSSYAALTSKVAEAGAIRAVASANGANAISILVPCHRVIGSAGELVGYAGGLPAKERLLQLEGALPHAYDLFTAAAEA